MTLIEELKIAIMARKDTFCADDFYHITTKRKAHQSAVAKVIRILRDKGFICAEGHRSSDISTREMVCYKTVPGKELVIKERKKRAPEKQKNANILADKFNPNEDWWKKVAAHPVMKAQNDLDAAMSGWR